MPIMITGSTGFIGRHVCAALTRDGHPILAMLRDPDGQIGPLRVRVDKLGGNSELVTPIAGDLDHGGPTHPDSLVSLTSIIHCGARFDWQLDKDSARRTNVGGSLAMAGLARRHNCRLVSISGFMLENTGHLEQLGVYGETPDSVDWNRVYRKVGAYEASKIEAALQLRAHSREQDLDHIEIQPATVAGHSGNGELGPTQPLHSLLDNLRSGKLTMIPGSPDHWLPLVAVDHLAETIARTATTDRPPSRLLALDPGTPNLQGLLAIAAKAFNRRPPKYHMPIPLLAALLRIPGIPALMNTQAETLHFLQPTRFDTSATDLFLEEQKLSRPPIGEVIHATANYVQSAHMKRRRFS